MNLRAYAKINIGLRVLDKRPDGFHNIETIFHEIDLFDELTFEPGETISLTSPSPVVPTDERNLCVLAAVSFRKRTGGREGVKMTLKKNIPVGAGLGGGSSDAAAVLVALNRMWNASLDTADLAALAATLGSDVPFFIQGGTAFGTSRGEKLESIELKIPFWILTVTPPVHVSTSWAYSCVNPRGRPSREDPRSLVTKALAHPSRLAATVKNDFEEPVFSAHSEIRSLKERLISLGALFAQMSGSGSSVFGFFPDEHSAHKAKDACGAPLATSLTHPDFKADRRVHQ
ncbi:MAG TPA: 4-(cytidine 5'-diphospho)-2-C-methyl-D-erythritol kinase [Bacteroidota bacterium]|nr:4-(cytidine 5'-diphospho)-2-C-methyl-D-erythritol kinase [Bacteroidota bacterium]